MIRGSWVSIQLNFMLCLILHLVLPPTVPEELELILNVIWKYNYMILYRNISKNNI